MTKKGIIKTISEEVGLTQLQTGEVVQKMFDAIVEALATEGRVEFRKFGVFEVKRRRARSARNPQTGAPIAVPEKQVVSFKAGKEMKLRIKQAAQSGAYESRFIPSDACDQRAP